jgi:cobalt/nickel transport system permease protein
VGDAQLSGTVLAVGAVGAAVGVARALARLDERSIPKVALLSSAFFAVSLWHLPLPIPGTSIHLVLLGLLGLLLGWNTFLAVGVVLLFQALLLGHGGVTTLGVNTLAMSLPGPILAGWMRSWMSRPERRWVAAGGFLIGSGSVLLASVLIGWAYWASDPSFISFLPAYYLAHLPLMFIEGVITSSASLFLARVRPDVMGRAEPLQDASPPSLPGVP